jgi:hypothetical protein
VAQVSRDHCLMKPALSTIGQMRLKPDSRALGRGALGDAIDGRSREGKFIRRIEAELLDQLGDNEPLGVPQTLSRSCGRIWVG